MYSYWYLNCGICGDTQSTRGLENTIMKRFLVPLCIVIITHHYVVLLPSIIIKLYCKNYLIVFYCCIILWMLINYFFVFSFFIIITVIIIFIVWYSSSMFTLGLGVFLNIILCTYIYLLNWFNIFIGFIVNKCISTQTIWCIYF